MGQTIVHVVLQNAYIFILLRDKTNGPILRKRRNGKKERKINVFYLVVKSQRA